MSNVLRHAIHPSDKDLYALKMAIAAAVIGVVVGLASIGFIYLIQVFRTLLYVPTLSLLSSAQQSLSQYAILIALPLAGVLSALIVTKLIKSSRFYGISEVIEANALHKGQINVKNSLLAGFSACLSMGAGASVGREGPMVLIGAAISASLGRRLGLNAQQLRVLLACGAAAAVAASFNTPFAGVIFAIEVIIGSYSVGASAQLLLAAAMGTAVRRIVMGDSAEFSLQLVNVSNDLLLPAMVLGVIAGFGSTLFMRSLRQMRAVSRKLLWPLWLKAALAGFIVALMGLLYPDILGVSYNMIQTSLGDGFVLQLALILLGAKFLASILCLSFGFSGGVFSPSLAMGALIGLIFGLTLQSFFPHYHPAVFAALGMAAFSAPVMGAPLSTVLIVFEMTSSYPLMLGTMAAVLCAHFVTQALNEPSFFIGLLRERGLSLNSALDLSSLYDVKVTTLMHQEPLIIPSSWTSSQALAALLESPDGAAIIVDQNRDYLGVINLEQHHEALNKGQQSLLELAAPCVLLNPSDNLLYAMQSLEYSRSHVLAVMDDKDQPLGLVFEQDLLRVYGGLMNR